jgi:hypothetical protein
MDGQAYKWLHVGRFDYIINDHAGQTIDQIVAAIKAALDEKTVVTVPVLDENRNKLTLYLNGAQTDALVLDVGEGPPKPGEFAP